MHARFSYIRRADAYGLRHGSGRLSHFMSVSPARRTPPGMHAVFLGGLPWFAIYHSHRAALNSWLLVCNSFHAALDLLNSVLFLTQVAARKMLAARRCTSPVTACQECDRQLGSHVVRITQGSSDARRRRAVQTTSSQTPDAACRLAATLRCRSRANGHNGAAQSAQRPETEKPASAGKSISCDGDTSPAQQPAGLEPADHDMGVRCERASTGDCCGLHLCSGDNVRLKRPCP
jgi:hypothetical protein